MVPRHDADEIPRAVAPQDEGLEHGRNVLAQLFGHMRRREVLPIDTVGNQLVGDLRRSSSRAAFVFSILEWLILSCLSSYLPQK